MLTPRVGEAGKCNISVDIKSFLQCNIAFGNKLGMRFWRGADLHDDGYVTKKQFGSVFFFYYKNI